MKINKVLVGTLALIMITSSFPAVFAGAPNDDFLPVVPQCGDMYVVTGGVLNDNVDDGALALVDFPGTGDLTQIGLSIADQVDRRSLPGMAFDSNGRLFVVAQGGGDAILLQINPSNGVIINNIGPVMDADQQTFRVRDLAMHNDVLWGTDTDFPANLLIINTGTAIATLVLTDTSSLNGLAITPDGTFYATQPFAGLFTVDPITGFATFVTNLDTPMDGLGSDDQGRIFGTETGPDSVHLIDISDGSDMTVGAVGDNPSDVDFFPCKVVGGEFLPIDSTALLLAAASSPASWLATLTIAALGIGVYVFTRNPNNMRNIKVILRDYLDRF